MSAADLGLLTSLYFLGFAGAQIPAGVMLDHFGPRRVTAGMLLFAAAGATVFGAAHNLGTMMVGRLLIGVGVSVCLGAAFKALAQHFPVGRLPLVNGLVMAVGGLGGVMVGSPLTWLLGWTSWRAICFGLAVLTVIVAASIGLGAPGAAGAPPGRARQPVQGHVAYPEQPRVLEDLVVLRRHAGRVLRDAVAVGRAVPARCRGVRCAACRASRVGARLRDDGRLRRLCAAARVLERRGVSVYAFCGVGMALFVATQAAIVARVPLPPAVLWAAYGMFGGVGILTYAVMAGHFPAHLIGRANTTLTLVIFLLIFAFQIGVGAVLSHWPAVDGRYPAAAHFAAWGVLLALQLASAVWYVWPARAGQAH